jgi:hypothetical protein
MENIKMNELDEFKKYEANMNLKEDETNKTNKTNEAQLGKRWKGILID